MPRMRFFITLFLAIGALALLISGLYALKTKTDIRSKAANIQTVCKIDNQACCLSFDVNNDCSKMGVCKNGKCKIKQSQGSNQPPDKPTPSLPPPGGNGDNGGDNAAGSQKFQLSTWIDANLVSEGVGTRGYWFNKDVNPDLATRPSLTEITKAKNILRKTYHLNQIYLIITRQYEINDLKSLMLDWKNAVVDGADAPVLIPALVLQNYVDNGCNFTNSELTSFVQFLRDSINSDAIAVMDVYNINTDSNRHQCNQLQLIKDTHGGELHRLGLQPGEPLKAPFTLAVEDTYSGIANGRTYNDWSTKCGYYNGKTMSAKEMLRKFIDERVGSKPVAWDLIAVAMDYTKNNGCGADTVEDVPLETGRNGLAHDLIIGEYPGGGENDLWRGFSFDFKVLDGYSIYRDASDQRPYAMLKKGLPYAGYFSAPLNEIAGLFKQYNE